MKHIIKKYTALNEPKELTDFKKKVAQSLKSKNLQSKQAEVWEKFKKPKEPKNTIKQLLIEEQGYICCYCQQRIDKGETTQIEHLVARAVDARKMFDYDNLLACCKGGESERQTDKTFPEYCGASKGNKTIEINPLQTDCESFFVYEVADITEDSLYIKIVGKTPEAQNTLDTLHLNCAYLQEQRGVLYSVFLLEAGEFISKEEATGLLAKIYAKTEGKFQVFCAMLKSILAEYTA
ncbi:MAG: TIGR02646 family protein [Bacteroidetes bacterium]|nr:MAG: TIGR02646 family protein [Bacteroidota bacterium]